MYNDDGYRDIEWEEVRLDLSTVDVYLHERGLFDLNIACLAEGIRRGDDIPPVQLVRVDSLYEIVFQGHHTCRAFYQEQKPLPAIVVAEKDRLGEEAYLVKDATIVEAPLECVKSILADKAYRIPNGLNIPEKLLRKHRPFFNPAECR